MFYLTKTSPKKEMSIFDNFFNREFYMSDMKTDIKETDKEYILTTDLPGVEKNNINLTFEDSTLRIEVNQNVDNETEEDGYIRKERSVMNMSRDFYLDNGDENSIKAKLKDGVLTVTVAKLSEKAAKRKSITIG